jgi:hypothetical protein
MAYKNKEDQAACAKRYYEDNKERMKAAAKERNILTRKRNRKYIANIKSHAQCVDCGEKNPVVLDFDHVRGEKLGDVSNMVNQSYFIEALEKEIDKCEIRCSNCHRIVTHKRRIKCKDQ